MAKPLVLVGLMGSGKTSVGKALAKLLGRRWIDLDTELEKLHGKSVARQFSEEGEAVFRERERALLKRLAGRGSEDAVVSSGGGVVLDAGSRKVLKSCTTVYLQVAPESILRRLDAREIAKRPLLSSGDPGPILRRLARSRGPWYRACATLTVRAGTGTPEALAKRIAVGLGLAAAGDGSSRVGSSVVLRRARSDASAKWGRRGAGSR